MCVMAISSEPEIRHVTVVGAGTMGGEIAVRASLRGFQVLLHDLSDQALSSFARYMEQPEGIIRRDMPFLFESEPQTPVDLHGAYERIRLSTDPLLAADCDLLVESVTENLRVKCEMFTRFHELCPSHAIFTTNSSTLIPSELAAATGRPAQFAALHFALGSSIVEIMAHPSTSAGCLKTIDRFARRVADVVVHCRRESRGYALNKLLMWFNSAALDLTIDGIASPEDIDRLCMKSYGAKIGPFGTLDGVGLDTVYAITDLMAKIGKDSQGIKRLEYLKQFLDRGMLGKKTGSGFYRYPHPAYEEPGFLSNAPFGDATESAAVSRPPGEPVSASPQPSAKDRRMGRFALKMVDAPLGKGRGALSFAPGAALVVGDNSTAEALCRLLRRHGLVVHQLLSGINIEDALARVDAMWQSDPVCSLFLVTARDSQATRILESRGDWEARRRSGLILPFRVCQRWYHHLCERELQHQGTLVAITALGGDFGLSGRSSAVEGGALAGLLKSVRVEAPSLARVKIIDAAADEPVEALVDSVARELAARSDDVEVAFVQGRRRVIRAVRELPDELPRRCVEAGSVWLATGGARGVTAIAARHFARRHRVRLHLLGTCPPPRIDPRWREMPEQDVLREVAAAAEDQKWKAVSVTRKMLEIDRTLQACAADGVQATYHSCDAGDHDQLRAVLGLIRRLDGPIYGVIHGAGVDTTMPLTMIPPRSLEMVARGKLDGAAALIELTQDDPLKFFIGFGSTSGRFGAMCNADYAMANEMMCKMVGYIGTLRPGCTSLSLHWTAWDDAGMCMRPRSRRGLEMINLKLMPSEEGAAHLIEAIETRTESRELLITDHPHGIHSSHASMSRAD